MSVERTQSTIDRYFAVMAAEEDFAPFFDEEVTWLMVDDGHEVRGAEPVRDHILELHGRMQGGDQRPLVVTDGHAYLEGRTAGPGAGDEPNLAYCLVYDVEDDRITALRCYGTIARLMSRPDREGPSDDVDPAVP